MHARSVIRHRRCTTLHASSGWTRADDGVRRVLERDEETSFIDRARSELTGCPRHFHFVHRSSSSLKGVFLKGKPPRTPGLDIFESGCDRKPPLKGFGLHAMTVWSPGARAPATQVLPWFEHSARGWSNFSIRNSSERELRRPFPGARRWGSSLHRCGQSEWTTRH